MFEQEKRIVPRVKIKWPVTMLSPYVKVEGEIENVSSKGVFISCKDLPPLEKSFHMVIRASDYNIMNLNGKVVWSTVSRSSEGNPNFGIGVQFTRMSPDSRQVLHRMIGNLYRMKTSRKTSRSKSCTG
jgi:Tfp pilus assembly protein PilZ